MSNTQTVSVRIHPTLAPTGLLYTPEGFINLKELVAFDGSKAYLKNGETIVLSDGLAKEVMAYCRNFHAALERIPQQG